MPKQQQKVTIENLALKLQKKLIGEQDFGAAAAVRQVLKAIDNASSKTLTRRQGATVRAFLDLIAKKAYG